MGEFAGERVRDMARTVRSIVRLGCLVRRDSDPAGGLSFLSGLRGFRGIIAGDRHLYAGKCVPTALEGRMNMARASRLRCVESLDGRIRAPSRRTILPLFRAKIALRRKSEMK